MKKEVIIGYQVWMAENLNVDKFRNGDLIPEAKTDEEWKNAGENGQPAWCFYENDPANETKYGKLYNWFAVNDPRGLSPVGYHIPSDQEWTILTDYLGGEVAAGCKIKSSCGWSENGNGTNDSGFSGLPGGYRHQYGSFFYVGYLGNWWSSTEKGNYKYYWSSTEAGTCLAWSRGLSYRSGRFIRGASDEADGFSVRCLRD